MNLEEMIDFTTHLKKAIYAESEKVNEILSGYGLAAQPTIKQGLDLIPRGEEA